MTNRSREPVVPSPGGDPAVILLFQRLDCGQGRLKLA